MSFPSSELFPSLEVFPEGSGEVSTHRGAALDFPVEITDEFLDPQGEFSGYSAISPIQEEQLRKQKHVDIRSFVPDLPAVTVSMYYMDRLAMADLDGKELAVFSAAKIIVTNNEEWTFGAVGPQADRNNWNGIAMVCDPAISSTTMTQSVITQYG